ncbi:hypothetical protein ACKWTF_016187 [Chironomus riparius]
MMEISWDVVFFGVFMLLNLLQTLLLTIFILKVRKNKKKSTSLQNHCSVKHDQFKKRIKSFPEIDANVYEGNENLYTYMNQDSEMEHDQFKEIKTYSEINAHVYEGNDNVYTDMGLGKNLIQNMKQDSRGSQAIYEELPKATTRVEVNEASETYAYVSEMPLYDKTDHMQVSSPKHDPSYDTVRN